MASKYVVHGRKWFISGAALARHFILVARTSDDPRRGLTAFLYHGDDPGWRIVRRIAIMGPEEHGGVCELEFDGLEIPEEHRLLEEGDGLRFTQLRLGPARLTHCMRWLGLAKRCIEIAQAYVSERKAFGTRSPSAKSVQMMLGDVAKDIEIGRLLTMKAAWKLDRARRRRATISMAKIHVADTLHKAADTGIQLLGAKRLFQGHGARLDLPLCAGRAADRRRIGSAPHADRPRSRQAGPRFLALELG